MALTTRAQRISPARPFSRDQVEGGTERALNRGGWGNPDVLLVRIDGAHFVVKDYAPRTLLVRMLFGRFLLRREARAYERLRDLRSTPLLRGWLDRDALVLEYRPGVLLSRSLAGRLPAAFMTELERCVEAMHERGVVHLDLRHRSNVLAGDDGHPVVLDFASALFFDPDRLFGRLGRRLTSWIDLRALEKWRVRLEPSQESERGAHDSKTVLGENRS